MRKKSKIIIILGAIIVTLLIGGITSLPHFSRNTYTVTITDKQVKRHGEDEKYLIYAETSSGETKVFEDVDTLIERKFNSSDIYGQLKVNKKYEVKTYGWRINFFSSYQNIIKVKEVK